jgi:hypothetical protein
MRINLYSQSGHTLVVDGISITDFMEGDCITIDDEGNAAQRTLGASGPSMSISAYAGGKCSVILKATGAANGKLYALREDQQRSSARRMFSMSLFTGVNETIRITGAAFAKLPAFSTGGEKEGPRQFDFEYLRLELDKSDVESVDGSFTAANLF